MKLLYCLRVLGVDAEVLAMQPHLLKGLADKFEEEVNNLSSYATPGTPRFNVD
jgi:hypothetical protein